MLNTATRSRCWGPALALVLFLTTGALADSWVYITPDGSLGVKQAAPAEAPQVDVLGYDGGGIRVSVDVPGMGLQPRKTKGGEFVVVTWPDAAPSGEIGTPALPVIRQLFIAPPGAAVSATATVGTAAVIDLSTVAFGLPVMPRQAPVPKIPGARENAPFDFNPAAYAVDADYLADPVTVTELGIARGQRLFMLEVHPVAYNPVAQTITFRSQIDVSITFSGGGRISDLSPLPGLNQIVLNPDGNGRSTRGSGNYLIIVSTTYESDIASFGDAKAAQGFTVMTHVLDPGTPNTTIKSYIQDLWGTENAPEYILLVGDTNTIPHWVGGGSDNPSTDLPYACMNGSGDWYPDIAIGRFPVSSIANVATLVDKTLYYENGPLADPTYKKRAAFMAGTDYYWITEGTHNYVIDAWLAPNDYQCDRLYQVTYGANTQDVRDSFNGGRFYGVYSGHGNRTRWGNGPPFYPTDVNDLTNENMYAFICSFSCLTGDFVYPECFMETWVLAPDKAAVCSWGSSADSYWDEDDILERRLFDAIFDNEDDVKTEAGPIYNEAKMRYLEYYGPTDFTRRYFEMYNLLGDPSLGLPSSCSDAGEIALDRNKYACEGTAQIEVLDCGLNLDDGVVDTVDVTIASDSEPTGETVTLYETDTASAQFQGSIALSMTDAAGVLLVAEGDTVTATYIDEDDGQGGYNVVVTATAVVDCTPPEIWNIQTINIEPRSATVTFDANEIVRGTVHYGLSCDDLPWSASGGYGNPASVNISGLQDDTTYFYMVVAADEAGNETSDDNNGNCYMFTTPEVPDFFTESFESGGNDLAYLTLLFTPNASVDYYAGCTEEIDELPTDPSGGSTIYLSDDDYEYRSLSGGETISLYGVEYSGFYVGSNGYITFTAGDTDYTESLEGHFDTPRVSALFDDLNPSTGGTVSWLQLDDRAVVTYQNVPEYGASNSNTFQIELYFNGDIRISYLSLAASDGLAGLSEGEGLDPDYYPSDLSAMGSCGPRPPTAHDNEVSTPANTPLTITLEATDDGLPEPPHLDFIIGALPEYGILSDPGADVIESVPYTLVDGGSQVVYTPDVWFLGEDYFQFYANDGGEPPEGGNSNIATVVIDVTPPDSELMYEFPLDSDPGWATEGLWAFGQPTGGGTHNRDPVAGHTGENVYGYNLLGDYSNNMPVYYLTTTPAIDCTDRLLVELRFWKWLGVESSEFDHATVEVSSDGANWTEVWSNPTYSISDWSWHQMALDLSAVADDQPMVYIRWGMGPTDAGVTYPGWNVDDVEIWAVDAGPPCPGDLDGDGDVDLSDLSILLANYGMTSGAEYEDGDLDGDSDVDLTDLSELLAVYGTTCD